MPSVSTNRALNMDDQILKLSRYEQAEIIHGVATRLGRAPAVLEKDIWVCWTLEHLFQMPGRLPMVGRDL